MCVVMVGGGSTRKLDQSGLGHYQVGDDKFCATVVAHNFVRAVLRQLPLSVGSASRGTGARE